MQLSGREVAQVAFRIQIENRTTRSGAGRSVRHRPFASDRSASYRDPSIMHRNLSTLDIHSASR